MKKETKSEQSTSAWIDEINRIISFTKAEGFTEVRFGTHREMFEYVIWKSESGYRIQ